MTNIFFSQGVVSLELLTVFVVGPLACWVCYDIARKNPRANILMIIIATAEIYGGMLFPLAPLFIEISSTNVLISYLTLGLEYRLHDLLP